MALPPTRHQQTQRSHFPEAPTPSSPQIAVSSRQSAAAREGGGGGGVYLVLALATLVGMFVLHVAINGGGRAGSNEVSYEAAPPGEFVAAAPEETWKPEDAGIGFGRDLPYRSRRRTSGYGRSLVDGRGGLRPSMVKVAVPGPGGTIEYVDGDDPRARALTPSEAELDTENQRLLDQASIDGSAFASDTAGPTTVIIGKR